MREFCMQGGVGCHKLIFKKEKHSDLFISTNLTQVNSDLTGKTSGFNPFQAQEFGKQ